MQSKPWKPTKPWWTAYENLHGNGEVKEIAPVKPRKKRSRDEEIEQEKFNVWWDKEMLPLGRRWFHPPNGGNRHGKMVNGKWIPLEGLKFKRMGVKRGVPDVICGMARKSFYGLVIEFKRVDGKTNDVSEEQQGWLDWFKRQNWSAHVAFGFEEAKAIVLWYFEGDEK